MKRNCKTHDFLEQHCDMCVLIWRGTNPTVEKIAVLWGKLRQALKSARGLGDAEHALSRFKVSVSKLRFGRKK